MHWSFYASVAKKAKVALASFQERFSAVQGHLQMDISNANVKLSVIRTKQDKYMLCSK